MPKAYTKQLAARMKAPSTPDEGQLAAIRAYTHRDFTPDELMVREFVLAHNAIDRDNEVFDESLLSDFAATIPGKGVYIKHPQSYDGDSGPAEGRVFAASIERMSLEDARTLLREPKLTLPPDRTEIQLLKVSVFFVRYAENEGLLLKLDAGIAGDVSVGFSAAGRDVVKDSEGRDMRLTRWRGPGEALEMSLVWLGAQPGARAVKNAPKPGTHEDEDMELKQQLEQAEGSIKTLTAERDEARKAAANLDAVKTALGDDATLLDNPADLADAVKTAKAAREESIDALVKAERLAGTVGDSDEEVAAAKAAYADFPTVKLKSMAKRFAALETANPGVTGGDTAPAKPTTGGKGTKTDSPLDNPLIAG